MSNTQSQRVARTCANCCSTNREVCKVVIFQFLNCAGAGALMPYISLYFKHLGMTLKQTGTIIGVVSLLMSLVRPLSLWAGDKTNKHRILLVLFCILNGIFFILLLFVPKEVTFQRAIQINAKIFCNPFNSYIRDCSPIKLKYGTECPVLFTDYVREAAEFKFRESELQNQYLEKMYYSTGKYHVTSNQSLECGVTCAYAPSQTSNVHLCFSNDSKSMQFYCPESVQILRPENRIHFNIVRVLVPWIVDSTVSSSAIQKENGCAYFAINSFIFKELSSVNMICGGNVELRCNMTCADTGFHSCVQMVQTPEQQHNATVMIIFVVMVYLIAVTIWTSYTTLGHVTCVYVLGIDNIWRLRVWGLLGYAVFVVLAATLADLHSEDMKQNFKPLFYLYVTTNFSASILPASFKFRSEIKSQISFLYLRSLGQKQYILLLITIIAFGFLFGVYEIFLFWFIGDKFGDNRLIIPGVTLLITSATEILLYFVSEVITRKLGVWNCIYVTMGIFVIRFLCFSLLTNPWQLLPLEVLCGINFGLLPSAVIMIGDALVPRKHWLSYRVVAYSLHNDIGRGLGVLITGFLADGEALGWIWCFRVYACSVAVLIVILITLNRCATLKTVVSTEATEPIGNNLEYPDIQVKETKYKSTPEKEFHAQSESYDGKPETKHKILINEKETAEKSTITVNEIAPKTEDKHLESDDNSEGDNDEEVWSPIECKKRKTCDIRCEFVATV